MLQSSRAAAPLLLLNVLVQDLSAGCFDGREVPRSQVHASRLLFTCLLAAVLLLRCWCATAVPLLCHSCAAAVPQPAS